MRTAAREPAARVWNDKHVSGAVLAALEGVQAELSVGLEASAGGHDRALLQWRINRLEPPRETDARFRGSKGRYQDAQCAWYL